MPIDWQSWVDWVHCHSRFLVMTHLRPDGDAIGSEIALAEVLRQLGKSVQLLIGSPMPERLHFLDPEQRIQLYEAPGQRWVDCDAIVIVDTGTWNQLGDFADFLRTQPIERCVIDHHRTQDDLGGLQLVDVSAEANVRLIYEAAGALHVPLTPTMATALFVGLASDTGWFRHPNTTARSYALAETLTLAGAKPSELYERLYEHSSLSRLKLIGRVMERLQVGYDGQLAWSEIWQSDFHQIGVSSYESEELVSLVRGVQGVLAVALLTEMPNGTIRASLRAKEPVDVGQVAEQFGGGGHRAAAGATLPGPIEVARQQLLPALEKALRLAQVSR